MWPFTRTAPTPTQIQERLEALERKFKALTTDWDETYEKFQRLNARMAQRWRRLAAAEDEQGDGGPSDRVVEGSGRSGHPANGQEPITNPLALELLRGNR